MYFPVFMFLSAFLGLFLDGYCGCSAPFLDSSAKRGKKIFIIDPAGHAESAGRKLKNGYERAETFKLAKYIQEQLEYKNDELKAVLTRNPGETVVDFQNASLANRLNADLFLSFHFCWSSCNKPELFIYHYVSDPVIDFARHSTPQLNLVSVLSAHQFNIYKSKDFATRVQQGILAQKTTENFEVSIPFGIPVKPLLGIVSPAILIEIGWPNGDSSAWKCLADVIISSINPIIAP